MKKTYFHILLIVLVTGLGSCKKWLDLKPQDGIVGDEFWNTKEQVEAAVTGVYTSLQASQDELDIVNLNMLPDNRFANWRTIYQSINYCNTIIQMAPGVLQKDNTFDQAQLDRAVGQALAIRGLLYFYLVRSFGEVPLKTTATVSDNDVVSLAKSSKEEVLKLITDDLQKAAATLPETYGAVAQDKGRVTRYGANAILADVYLCMDK